MSETPRVTIRDIAARLKVSHVTVSLALKDSPRISEKRRDQVRRTADQMGYRPDPILSSLMAYRHSKKSPPIHSALAWINHWEKTEALRNLREFEAYWKGASTAAERFGYHLEEFVWNPQITPQRMETILLTRNVRGVLLPPHPAQPNWGEFHWDKFSVIRFGLTLSTPTSHVVTSDHSRSTMTAMEVIHRYGYERIGFVVNGPHDINFCGSWTGGYAASQELLHLRNRLPALVTHGGMSKEEFNLALKRWITKHKPDAILTAAPHTASALADLGIRVPDDIAIAATSVVDVPGVDAGIDQNSLEIGRVATETLISLINTNDRGKPRVPRRILVEGTWVDGLTMPNRTALKPAVVAA